MKIILAALFVWTALILLAATAFQTIWNHCVVKAISVANPIDYWTALGIFLCWFVCFYRFTDSGKSS